MISVQTITNMEENCCLNCKHFRIWDEDPCCLEKEEFKIVLPTEICKKHDLETFKPAVRLHESCWQDVKKAFFGRYTITEKNLIDRYLEFYPEDKDLIETNGRE